MVSEGTNLRCYGSAILQKTNSTWWWWKYICWGGLVQVKIPANLINNLQVHGGYVRTEHTVCYWITGTPSTDPDGIQWTVTVVYSYSYWNSSSQQ
jgi:hypothetical protein